MERFILVTQHSVFLLFSYPAGDLEEGGVRTGLGHLEIPSGSTYDGSFQKVSEIIKCLKTTSRGFLGIAQWYRCHEISRQFKIRGRIHAGL